MPQTKKSSTAKTTQTKKTATRSSAPKKTAARSHKTTPAIEETPWFYLIPVLLVVAAIILALCVIIGGGDLNAAMESDAMKSIVADGLADAQATAAVSPKSFHTDHYDPRRDAKGAYHGVPAVRGMADKVWSLDHVFYDPATVSVSRFDLDITPEACALSDHHPIIADFSLAGSDAR